MIRYISPILYLLLIIVGCMAFISIASVRVGIFEPQVGFSMLRKSVFASLFLSLLAILSLRRCRKEHNLGSQRFFILVLAISLLYSSMWIVFYIQKSGLPKINDITTNLESPPAYMNVSFIRKSSENSLLYNESFILVQQNTYPEVQPIFTSQNKDEVHQRIVELIKQRGWEIVADYSQVGVVEATARTPIFGFRDDVVVRIMDDGDGRVRIDMRSCSRIGTGDFGVNAHRVSAFLSDLAKTL